MLKDFGREEYEDRWERTRTLMEATGVEVLMATRQSNYRYLCGHRSVQFALEARPMVLLLPLRSDPVLLIHAGEVADAKAQTWVEDVRGYEGLPFEAGTLAATMVDLGLAGARIGCELGPAQRLGLSQRAFETLRAGLPGACFTDASDVLETVRMRKSEAEVARVRRACEVAALAYELVLTRVHTGMTVEGCERLCLEALADAGGDLDVRGVVSFGPHPGDHVYRRGDLFHLDLATSHRGYRADLARRATFGPADDEQRRDQKVIVAMQRRVLEAIQPGAPARSVMAACNQRLGELGREGPGERAWIGHGLGLDLLERPWLDLRDETSLAAGMVLTPEPWFRRGSGTTVMVEETVLVTEKGAEPLVPWGFETLRTIDE